MGEIQKEKISALKAIIASRKTRVAVPAGARSGRTSEPVDCPVCSASAVDILRVQSVDGDAWRIVLCDRCGPEQGGLSPIPADADPDIVPGEIRRTAMLDQGDDDMRWAETDMILAEIGEDQAEEAVLEVLEEIEEGVSFRGEGVGIQEWIGGGLGPHAEDLYTSEIFVGWPGRETWRVLCVLEAHRLKDRTGGTLLAVVNRGLGQGVWCICY